MPSASPRGPARPIEGVHGVHEKQTRICLAPHRPRGGRLLDLSPVERAEGRPCRRRLARHPERGWPAFGLCVLSTLVAYAALAWYDRIALMHVGKVLSWAIVSVVSFVAYAVGHNIGVSVLSSGVVRYRAYSRMGLNAGEVAIVTAFCAFTFAYGAILLGGIVLVFEPELITRLFHLPEEASVGLGLAMIAAMALYQLGAILHFKPLVIRSFVIEYPRPAIAFRQLFAAPIEIIGAAGIIYFALPELNNPGFFAVLGIFLASFCAGLLSNAPGGIGVFEAVFLLALPEVPKADVLGALIMFRLLYLLVPLAMSCFVILAFERRSLARNLSRRSVAPQVTNPPIPTAAVVKEQIEPVTPPARPQRRGDVITAGAPSGGWRVCSNAARRGRGRLRAAAGDGHRRRGELDAVLLERLLDQGIGLAPQRRTARRAWSSP